MPGPVHSTKSLASDLKVTGKLNFNLKLNSRRLSEHRAVTSSQASTQAGPGTGPAGPSRCCRCCAAPRAALQAPGPPLPLRCGPGGPRAFSDSRRIDFGRARGNPACAATALPYVGAIAPHCRDACPLCTGTPMLAAHCAPPPSSPPAPSLYDSSMALSRRDMACCFTIW